MPFIIVRAPGGFASNDSIQAVAKDRNENLTRPCTSPIDSENSVKTHLDPLINTEDNADKDSFAHFRQRISAGANAKELRAHLAYILHSIHPNT